MSAEAVEDVKNEEATDIANNEVIEETSEEAQVKDASSEARELRYNAEANEKEDVKTELEEEAKPKAKATPKKLARTVKVVELVECQACNKKMLPKSLKNTHPHYCKGQPTETLPVKKQKASYGSKVEQKLRKEIEEEMKAKYANKENDKNAQNVKNEVVSYSEPIEVKTKAEPVRMEEPPSREASRGSTERQLTARELLEASYAEIRRAKREAQMEKINGFKSKMF